MGVSTLDEFDFVAFSVGDLFYSQGGVGVAIIEANCILVTGRGRRRVTSTGINNVASLIGSRQLFPELSRSCVCVINCFVGGSVEGFHCIWCDAANNVFVVAVVLGKGLLENRTPDGAILAYTGKISRHRSIALVING